MKAILIPFLSLLIPLTPQSAFAQSEPELKLESVVIVSRHGVRAPTKEFFEGYVTCRRIKQ